MELEGPEFETVQDVQVSFIKYPTCNRTDNEVEENLDASNPSGKLVRRWPLEKRQTYPIALEE